MFPMCFSPRTPRSLASRPPTSSASLCGAIGQRKPVLADIPGIGCGEVRLSRPAGVWSVESTLGKLSGNLKVGFLAELVERSEERSVGQGVVSKFRFGGLTDN